MSRTQFQMLMEQIPEVRNPGGRLKTLALALATPAHVAVSTGSRRSAAAQVAAELRVVTTQRHEETTLVRTNSFVTGGPALTPALDAAPPETRTDSSAPTAPQ
jgi:hypothetical protein